MLSTQQIIDKTNELGAHNYHPTRANRRRKLSAPGL